MVILLFSLSFFNIVLKVVLYMYVSSRLALPFVSYLLHLSFIGPLILLLSLLSISSLPYSTPLFLPSWSILSSRPYSAPLPLLPTLSAPPFVPSLPICPTCPLSPVCSSVICPLSVPSAPPPSSRSAIYSFFVMSTPSALSANPAFSAFTAPFDFSILIYDIVGVVIRGLPTSRSPRRFHSVPFLICAQ